MTADLADFEELVALDHGLSTIAVNRAGHAPHVSVVNAGVLAHPITRARVVAFVAAGRAQKLKHARVDPSLAVTVRAGWRWVTVEGRAELIGPDDPHPGVDDERLRLLLREVFTAAGGSHDDWPAYDRTMREERRAAVLVTIEHAYSNRR